MIPTFSPEIRRILLNFLTRRWLWLVCFGSSHLLASFAFVIALAEDPNSKLNPAHFLFVMNFSFWLASDDIGGKSTRSLLALPVTANSLWNSYWWLTFGLPASACTAMSVLALAGARLTNTVALPFDKVLIWLIAQWVGLALGWCCLALLPSDDGLLKRRPIRSAVAGALRVLQLTLFVLLIPNSISLQWIVLGISSCALAIALFGKRLTGQFIRERIGRPDYPFQPACSRQSSERVMGHLGWMALARGFSARMMGLVCSGMAVWILSLLVNLKVPSIHHVYSLVYPGVLVSYLSVSKAFADAIRVLRQLPIDRSRLTLILLLPASLSIITWLLGFAVIAFAFQSELLNQSRSFVGMVRVLLAFAVFDLAIRLHAWSDKWLQGGVYVAVGLPVFLLVGLIPLSFDSNIMKWCSLVFAGVPAFYWTRWEISQGRTAYQRLGTNTDPIST